ncbi:FKBP-type peptidyl-prolyl cis-trans isomerase [Thermomonas sp.]|uniref:FKBP-type peptidyl-prolyl cis-trans isomerase n=1 Tax=Thermomonas sp. TaxID=1971895 RepID=UPI0024889149|nr:FKBP-type peptidyl-prolyl cis-trans isomerase [Thermomonas sp.]MDI1253260.1 FKBP-type peptidyl-prolyl cis-trans isomerase [Thermomonas sp.]
MKPVARATVLAIASVLALGACDKTAQKPADAKAEKSAEATKDAAADGKSSYPGLPTEKEQVSYMIGMMTGKQLTEIKDEVNLDTVVKAMRSQMADEKMLLTEDQAKTIGEGFSQKMQAKHIAKMMADAKNNLEIGNKFLADNAKKPGVTTTPSGLQYQVMTDAKGAKPGAKDGVKVNYKGSLLDGKTFDSSYDRGEPAVMPLDGVIPGWSEGLQLMPVGAKYKFWIPASLAYGEQAPPMIGPNQVLVFEVDLLDIVKPPSAK